MHCYAKLASIIDDGAGTNVFSELPQVKRTKALLFHQAITACLNIKIKYYLETMTELFLELSFLCESFESLESVI